MTTLAKHRVQRAENGLQTPLRLVKDATQTRLPDVPLRAERPCACGCGACFVPKNNEHRYLNAQHRQRRYIEDKKDATFAFVEAMFVVHGGASETTAARIAQETVDFYFAARCKILERAGWKYNSKTYAWELVK